MLDKMKEEMKRLSRHLEVARAVAEHEPIGIMKLRSSRSALSPDTILAPCAGTVGIYPCV